MLCSKTCLSLEDCLTTKRCSGNLTGIMVNSDSLTTLPPAATRGGGSTAAIPPQYFQKLEADLSMKEKDPSGKDPHEAGAKLDAGKRRDGLVLLGFSRALAAVSAVGTYGANKYTDNGWMSVPNGVNRYTDAMLRHILSEASGELTDKDTGLLHAAHAAWNALARLDLMIRESEK